MLNGENTSVPQGSEVKKTEPRKLGGKLQVSAPVKAKQSEAPVQRSGSSYQPNNSRSGSFPASSTVEGQSADERKRTADAEKRRLKKERQDAAKVAAAEDARARNASPLPENSLMSEASFRASTGDDDLTGKPRSYAKNNKQDHGKPSGRSMKDGSVKEQKHYDSRVTSDPGWVFDKVGGVGNIDSIRDVDLSGGFYNFEAVATQLQGAIPPHLFRGCCDLLCKKGHHPC